MTDEERAKSILAELEHNYIGYGNMQDDDAQGCRLIKEALKKQVPMKPKRNNYYPKTGVTEYVCSVCGKNSWYSVKEHQKYCSECGQAIDWEGVG